jgi:N-acetylglucosaminyldiphosphoundecaprenol N-acetyl-beta-D-mannosaminyltransferase
VFPQPSSESPQPPGQREFPRATVLGIPLDACSEEQLVHTVEAWIDDGDQRFAVPVNGHLVNLANADRELADILRHSGLNYADGQAVVWAARMLGKAVPCRLCTTDVIPSLAANWALRGFSVFLLGGTPGVAKDAARLLQIQHPGLKIAGTHHGYFDQQDAAGIIELINRSGAEILMVGLGNPHQEKWVWRYLDALAPNAILTCGGLFDWLSGRKRRAPAWMYRNGLEWLYRLLLEPRRLFVRYVVGNPRFCLLVASELWQSGRRRSDTLPRPPV